MNRFFVSRNQIVGNRITILEQDIKHIKNVLRLDCGDKIEVACDGNVYISEIKEIGPKGVVLTALSVCHGKNEPLMDVVLYQGIAKGDKMDFIVQKSTEIGVKGIVPLITDRTIVKFKDKKKEQNRLNRWRAIAKEAAKQSKRELIPFIGEIINLKEMVNILKGKDNIIVPYEGESTHTLREALANINSKEMHIIIGPEGGFEKEEIKALKGIGALPVTLGRRILRTETAGIVVLSIALYELGDIGVVI